MTVSYARGPSNVDWEDRVDIARLRRDRVRAVGEALDASDLDGLLLWKDENVRYLTSLRAQLIGMAWRRTAAASTIVISSPPSGRHARKGAET